MQTTSRLPRRGRAALEVVSCLQALRNRAVEDEALGLQAGDDRLALRHEEGGLSNMMACVGRVSHSSDTYIKKRKETQP